MATLHRHYFLLAYDVANPKRLGRLYRYLCKEGMPVQYSIFLLYVLETDLTRILAELSERIHPKEDDVRVYPLPSRAELFHVGASVLPGGVALFDDKGSRFWD